MQETQGCVWLLFALNDSTFEREIESRHCDMSAGQHASIQIPLGMGCLQVWVWLWVWARVWVGVCVCVLVLERERAIERANEQAREGAHAPAL